MINVLVGMCTILVLLAFAGMGIFLFLFNKHKSKIEAQNEEMKRLLAFVAKGQQLSTILDIRGAVLSVTPEQFKANRQALLTKIELVVQNEDHPNPGTWAYCVIDRSGLQEFLDSKTRSKLQDAVGRLRANGDNTAALNFLRDAVNQLEVEVVH